MFVPPVLWDAVDTTKPPEFDYVNEGLEEDDDDDTDPRCDGCGVESVDPWAPVWTVE